MGVGLRWWGLLLAVLISSAAVAQVPSYERDIQPIFDAQCVSCHACYDAPCQLKMTHPEGWRRGLTQVPIYAGTRLHDVPTTRLFEDAHSESEWRDKGFQPVVGPDAARSLLWAAVTQGAAHPLASDAPPPAELDLALSATRSCPALEDYAEVAEETPLMGMPYAMAPLPPAELSLIQRWLDAGAPVDTAPPSPSAVEVAEVARWETFLNRDGERERLVARYLYEHLFLAKITFEEAADSGTYRLVRSATPPGRPVVERATRRPNDPPGVHPGERIFYRLVPVLGTRIRKNYLPFPLSRVYQEHLETLFLAGDWTVVPGRAERWRDAQNPMVAFDAIPQNARYRFLLERSWYFISNFIRGPVCRGPVALDVIRDRFFVAFLDPSADLPQDFVDSAQNLLDLPGDVQGLRDYLRTARRIGRGQRRYLARKDDVLAETRPSGRTWDDLWSGPENSRLTVFRHHDSATVLRGWVGAETDTVWVMDYTTLERTYYSLVANFDVFGNAYHQAATRVHFDYLRAESEDAFLLFLPADARRGLRSTWYRGVQAKRKQLHQYRFAGRDLPSAIAYHSDDAKSEWVSRAAPALAWPGVAPPAPSDHSVRARVARQLAAVEEDPQPLARFLPEMTVLHVVVDATYGGDLVYSLTRDRAHRNTAFMFFEESRLQPERDRLTAVEGVLGDYPNRVFRVDAADVDGFFEALRAVASADAYRSLVDHFGIYRTSPALSAEADWLYRYDRAHRPLYAGRLDLNRYGGDLGEESWRDRVQGWIWSADRGARRASRASDRASAR